MSTPQDQMAGRFDLARRVAREAGRLTLNYFQRDNFEVQRKSDDSPVTVADREAEELLRRLISAQFPQDAVLGEELGEQPGTSGFRWILDPIDGTKSFIHGVPLYTTLVAIEHDARPTAGVIYAPALDEMVSASIGEGAWHETVGRPPRRASVSKAATLSESLLLTSEVISFSRGRPRDAMPVYAQLQAEARLVRTWGDAYGYLMVAVGRAEVMIDPVMNIWDAAALLPILQEAGGTFTDWQGRGSIDAGEGLATNGLVLEEVLAVTREH